MTSTTGISNALSSSGTAHGRRLSIDASLSNPIYGNSDTVQPESLTVRYIIKAFDGQTADSALIDITQYAQELAHKADITGSNMVYHKDVITTSGTYVAPVTGLYKITVKGGGSGGLGGYSSSSYKTGGTGGGEGGTTIAFEKMTAGQTASVVIGAGGTGGAVNEGFPTSGGNSSVTVNSNTYIGGGANYATGGTGTIRGASGGPRITSPAISGRAVAGSTGGGAGGGWQGNGVDGGGGAGGGVTVSGVVEAGFAGGDGFVWFEYYTPGA
jgi:hypothetical protein